MRSKWMGVPLLLLTLSSASVLAETVVDQLQQQYRAQGVVQADPQAGEALWSSTVDGKSCTSCHGAQVTEAGRHIKTKRDIEPMAPSVNPQRLTDQSKINKWFLRNCKWTFSRECTAQEKADILAWLSRQ